MITIDERKLERVAQIVGASIDKVRAFVLYDWSEPEDHQEWLDTATAEEIAEWVDNEAL